MSPQFNRRLAALCAAALVGAAASPVKAEPVRVTISYAEKTVDNLPVLLAYDAGYFKKRGLDVDLRYVPAQEGVPALISGQTQVASLGGSDAISANAQGARLTLVATLDPILAFQFWALPKYKTGAALKGQRVGLASTTGTLYSATVLALKQLGLTPSDVAMTPLGSVSNVNSALAAGSIAAAASHPPATYEFERAGLVDVVDLARERLPSASAGIFVTQSYAQAHRKIVQAIVDAVVDAIARAKSDRAFTEDEMRKYLRVKDQGELDFTYNFYVKDILAGGPLPRSAQVEANIAALATGNAKVKSVDPAKMIDAGFVEKASH